MKGPLPQSIGNHPLPSIEAIYPTHHSPTLWGLSEGGSRGLCLRVTRKVSEDQVQGIDPKREFKTEGIATGVRRYLAPHHANSIQIWSLEDSGSSPSSPTDALSGLGKIF